MDDSGEDLFLTQNSFRCLDNAYTQAVDEAAENVLDSSFDLTDDLPKGDIIEYWDFSHEHEEESAVKPAVQQQAFVPLQTNLLDDEDDDLLSQALDLAESKQVDVNRFGAPATNEELHAKALKSYSPATRKKLLWAHRIFTEWKIVHNATNALDLKYQRVGDLMEMDVNELVRCLCPFILEVRKQTGENYPAQTLYEIVICLQLYMSMYGREFKFIDDPQFVTIKNTLNNRMKELSRQGFVAPHLQAREIDFDNENTLWEKGILGDSNPKQLVHTLLYLLGVQFALRAGQEHRDLRLGPKSQFALYTDPVLGKEYLEYTEDQSKNNQGGIKQRKLSRKVVRAYVNEENPNRCLVRLYKKYVELRPKTDKCPDYFYLRPLNKPTDDCWFLHQPIGRKTLSKIVSELLDQIRTSDDGVAKGRVSNHSLRATCTSQLFQNNVDEQLIMDRTGHRSSSVCLYKRTSSEQLRNLSDILYGNTSKCSDDVSNKKVKLDCEATARSNNVQCGTDSSNVACEKVPENDKQISFNFTINLK